MQGLCVFSSSCTPKKKVWEFLTKRGLHGVPRARSIIYTGKEVLMICHGISWQDQNACTPYTDRSTFIQQATLQGARMTEKPRMT